MATFCSHCGEELPRDDVRFCNHCGAMRTARLASSPPLVSTDNNLSSDATPPERAQSQNLIEQASPPLQIKRASEQPPAWMRNLQRQPRHERALEDQKQQSAVSEEQEVKPQDAFPRNDERSVLPEPATHTTVMERPAQPHTAASSEQLDFPALPSTPQSHSPSRELRVKVWNEADPLSSQPGLSKDIRLVSPERKQPVEAEDMRGGRAVEDLPTRVMESMSPSSQASFPFDDIPTTPLQTLPDEQLSPVPVQNRDVQPPQKPVQAPGDALDVSHLNTVHLQVQPQSSPLHSLPMSSDHPVAQVSTPGLTTRTRKRLPLVIGSGAVLLLLILALGSWIILLQPFRVSPVTDTQQSFTDTKLGVSLRYPNGWKMPQVDYSKQLIVLQDGSDTAQINVNIANSSASGSPQSYLQRQGAQLGISNPKPGASSSFADSSWQSIQGDAQVRGAQYTYGLFTTLHNNHFYTLTQLAPSSTYIDEEKLVFAPTRLSFHFL